VAVLIPASYTYIISEFNMEKLLKLAYFCQSYQVVHFFETRRHDNTAAAAVLLLLLLLQPTTTKTMIMIMTTIYYTHLTAIFQTICSPVIECQTAARVDEDVGGDNWNS